MSNTSATVTIRPVQSSDLSEIATFIEPFVASGKLLPRTTEELEDLVTHGFVAESAGRIVGFAALEIYSPKMSEIRSLAVSPEFRGGGVGRRLVQQCVESVGGDGDHLQRRILQTLRFRFHVAWREESTLPANTRFVISRGGRAGGNVTVRNWSGPYSTAQ
jgi:ribosomal protein S18 acetylase RimI-like enzyme